MGLAIQEWIAKPARIGLAQSADEELAAAFPPGDAREDWAIIRALSEVLGKRLPYDSLAALRQAIAQVKNGKPALVDAVTQHR